MKFSKWGAVALIFGVALNALQSAAQAQYADEVGQYQSAYDAAQVAGDSLALYANFDEDVGYFNEEVSYLGGASYADEGGNSGSECSDCQSGGFSLSGLTKGYQGLLGRPGQFFIGATYIYARADYSEALAYVVRDPVAGGETYHMFDFNYNSSYGIDGGYRLCDCGGEIKFSFLRLQSDAQFVATPGQTGNQIFSPYEIDGNIQGSTDTDLKSYDLGFSKTIPLGSPMGCCDSGCSDSVGCGDGLCGWCPAWDLTWSVGVRFVDVDWSRGTTAVDNSGIFIDSIGIQMDFQGVGPRVGVLGRRYIGRQGRFSLFAKGDISLLLGDIDLNMQGVGTAGPGGFTRAKFKNIIPETDIEVGGTIHIRNRFNLSAGYFLSVFHDLGIRDEYDFNQFQLSHFDDANILGFDGFFARAEVTF